MGSPPNRTGDLRFALTGLSPELTQGLGATFRFSRLPKQRLCRDRDAACF